ncbi:hypothetical protein Misp01_42970 [Microtetraspora sp. NBRC 13810]|uniref:hypothetical protein n=1 Tax=Microtetraspora sp. NBRC 13810 TaxID=3030990 RepID=UPI0024A40697|nr:hypothetical protein [Microtetraspora sp. NBRC 13810]GLW09168.1 hypothetical protein Misp01_42970 [Microtetraspora sp. NBRC 13810]
MPIRRSGVVVLTAGLVLAAGCAAGTGAPAPAEEAPEVSAEVRGLRVPFDDYSLSRLDIHTVEHAEDLLTRTCMRGLGLDWETLPPPAEQDTDPLNRRRYGLIEPELARRYGYHLPPPAPDQRARAEVWRRREALSPAVRHAAYGADGQGGCRARARARLAEGLPDIDRQRLNGHIGETFRASQRDPVVVAVFGRWSACMRARGFTYGVPFDASADPAWARSGRASPREIAVAEADVGCKRQVGLVALWSAAEQRIQRAAVAAHPEDFRLFLRAREAELRNARQVIADAAGRATRG